MYEVKFTEEGCEKVANFLRSKISDRSGWKLMQSDQAALAIIEVWREMIATLQESPFSYHPYDEEIYLATEPYLPFVLAYRIQGDVVWVFQVLKPEEIFP